MKSDQNNNKNLNQTKIKSKKRFLCFGKKVKGVSTFSISIVLVDFNGEIDHERMMGHLNLICLKK